MTAETTLRLAHTVENIVGIKEASGDLNQVMEIVKGKPSEFAVISGEGRFKFSNHRLWWNRGNFSFGKHASQTNS